MSVATPGVEPWTFRELMELISHEGIWQPDIDYGFSADVHGFASIILEWQQDNMNNATAISLMNADSADPEFGSVKTTLNGFTLDQTLALQAAMDLAQKDATGYDANLLLTRFGLTP